MQSHKTIDSDTLRQGAGQVTFERQLPGVEFGKVRDRPRCQAVRRDRRRVIAMAASSRC